MPNFSEGRDMRIIEAIRGAIGEGVLHVDVGPDANRTVITFAGEPSSVVEGAFRAVSKAAELIDMSRHNGEHPRIGATDVLPLVPVSGVSLEECAELAQRLAGRIARELNIPCYLYEAAARRESYRNLSRCRKGEYEALRWRLEDEEEKPDLGSRPMDEIIRRTGCTVVGARKYLIAVNFNIASRDAKLAASIARDVREKGPEGRPLSRKGLKAIGWYMEEYGVAQVSCNLTDLDATPLHEAFLTISEAARRRGTEVTGTELIGLLPEKAYDDARPYLEAMRLSSVKPFNPDEKIIERLLNK